MIENDSKRYLVHCYSPMENKWTTLPPLPVKWFGLGQINGKLVAVGGVKRDKKKATVYGFDLQKWKKTIPSMAIARNFPAVLSLDKLLVVAGGNMEGGHTTNAVEIFQQATSQWHKAASLPQGCCNLSLVNSGNTIYALGGYDHPSLLNQALCTSIDDLLQVEDPTKPPVWRTLQSSPSYQPPAAMLFGNLLAVGGWTVSGGKVAQKNVYMHSSSIDSWVYFSDLPEPCAWTTCAGLSATEILVIGGRNEENVRAVYKGTLIVKA
jgi:N-acetylneuraminic acid mutarotase